MANTRIRLTPSTVELLSNLGQECGIEDSDTLIKLLIRKYGDQLVHLLSPTDPKRDRLTQTDQQTVKTNPLVNQSEQFQPTSDPNLAVLTQNEPISKNGSKPRPPITGF